MNYEEIRDIIRKKYLNEAYAYKAYNKEIKDYCANPGYIVFQDNTITVNTHIDLEVARTTFTFTDSGKLIDIKVSGWY